MEFQQTGKELMKQLQGFNGRVEAELKTLRDEYRMCPRGELYIRKKRGREYFYEKCREGERSVSGNREKVSKLVRKRVLEHEIRCREIVAENLEMAIRSIRISMVREERTNHALTMKRIYSSGKVSMPDLDRAAAEWRNENYAVNPYKPENRIYMTNCGTMVRSKSEKIIADKLWERQVNFRYEAQILIDGRVFYPDFTIRVKSGETVIWEHFGLMDDAEYRQDSLTKLEMYRKAGFKQHTNLICTDEDDIMSLECIDNIIKRYAL